MLSYTRGIIVAYRDVLSMIETLDIDKTDINLLNLERKIEDRIDEYIQHQGDLKASDFID